MAIVSFFLYAMRTDDRMKEVVRSLCEGGIQVSLSGLMSSITGSSMTPPVASHRGGDSTQPSHPPQAASFKDGTCIQCSFSFLAPIAVLPTLVRGERGNIRRLHILCYTFLFLVWIDTEQNNTQKALEVLTSNINYTL